MPRTNVKAGAVTRKGKVAIEVSKPVFRPNAGKMSAGQNYRLGKMQQRTTRLGINKAAANIRAAGEAVSQVTTPFAASLTTQRALEQRTAAKSIEAANLSKWNQLIDGNPDKSEGEESNYNQGNSTTSLLGG